MKARQTISWSPFSDKHKRYINNALKSKMSVGEGSVRSGKTIDHCIIAQAYLETCEDKIHLASGSSIGNAKLNIGVCNGFGIEALFRGRCKWGKFKDNECLYLYTKTGEKILIFAGGGKADSYKKILGNSYGLWIATEINEHYDSDDSRESFIKVAFGRQVASKQPMILWDLNPCNPHHRIYTDYIDKYKEGFVGGYNYEHFTLHDNLSITPERLKEIESQYDINSIWYKRDILGKRCVAEGLVYQEFADNQEKYLITEQSIRNEIMMITVGVDFGGNGSATTFVCVGFTRMMRKVVALYSERITSAINPEQLNERYITFLHKCRMNYPRFIDTYADSAEQVLIRGMRTAVIRESVPNTIHNARKNPIMERIRLLNKLIAQGRFFYCEGAESVRNAVAEAQWDLKHPDERLDDGSSDIDTMDALEYAIEPYMAELSRS